jgi:hypothetical protein
VLFWHGLECFTYAKRKYDEMARRGAIALRWKVCGMRAREGSAAKFQLLELLL